MSVTADRYRRYATEARRQAEVYDGLRRRVLDARRAYSPDHHLAAEVSDDEAARLADLRDELHTDADHWTARADTIDRRLGA